MWNIAAILAVLSIVFAAAVLFAWKRKAEALSMTVMIWLMLMAGLFYTVLVGESHREARRKAGLLDQVNQQPAADSPRD